MEITKDLQLLLWEKFNLKVCAIAELIFERMEEPTEEELQNAMDDELIYSEDLWSIMAYYQTPQEANLEYAAEEFFNDLLDILNKV